MSMDNETDYSEHYEETINSTKDVSIEQKITFWIEGVLTPSVSFVGVVGELQLKLDTHF